VPALRETLAGLGLGPEAAVVRLVDLDPARDARARALWDGTALRASHREAREALEASGARLPTLAPERAMVESFTVGGAALRNLALDPLLPDALVPGDERRALVECMKRYDELGRRAWRGLLAEHGVAQLRAPLDTRRADRPWATAERTTR
jgi:phenylacetic acid degradation operon negative regulatory protein